MRILLLCVGVYLASAVKLTDEVKDALVEKLFEDFKQKEDHVADPRFCADTGLTCYECSECHDHLQYGQCIADSDKSRRCLCKWGWTGPNARRVYVENEISEWSRNRVRAANCKTPCHYTHDYWNPQCADHCNEKDCKDKNGVCVNDKCVSCDSRRCFQNYGICSKGQCIRACDENICYSKGGTCIRGICKIRNDISDEVVEKLLEDFKEKSANDDADPRFCADTGLKCYKCSECHDHLQYGQCIDDDDKERRCLCKWGWTGPNAQHVHVANEVSEWSRNRVRASNCKKACHYTHDVWNPQCAAEPHCNEKNCNNKNGVCVGDKCVICDEKKCNAKYAACVNGKCKPTCIEKLCNFKHGTCIKGECIPKCNEKQCKLKGGKCFAGVCKTKCCRGHSGPNAIYVRSEDTYYADDCNTPCPYLGTGIENPDCTKSPKYPEPCDPKCEISGGKCDYSTGRCKCCQDWTGPNPTFDKSTKTVHADFCDTYCPYFTYGKNYGKMNMLCVNDNYVRRCQTKINLVGRMNTMKYGGR